MLAELELSFTQILKAEINWTWDSKSSEKSSCCFLLFLSKSTKEVYHFPGLKDQAQQPTPSNQVVAALYTGKAHTWIFSVIPS